MSAGNIAKRTYIRELIDSRLRSLANSGISLGTNSMGGYPNSSIYGGPTSGIGSDSLPPASDWRTNGAMTAGNVISIIRDYVNVYSRIKLVSIEIYKSWDKGEGGIGNHGSGSSHVSTTTGIAHLSGSYETNLASLLNNQQRNLAPSKVLSHSEVVRYIDIVRARINHHRTVTQHSFSHTGCHSSCHQSCHSSRDRR